MLYFVIYILAVNWISLFLLARDRYNSVVAGPRQHQHIWFFFILIGGGPSLIAGLLTMKQRHDSFRKIVFLAAAIIFVQFQIIYEIM